MKKSYEVLKEEAFDDLLNGLNDDLEIKILAYNDVIKSRIKEYMLERLGDAFEKSYEMNIDLVETYEQEKLLKSEIYTLERRIDYLTKYKQNFLEDLVNNY